MSDNAVGVYGLIVLVGIIIVIFDKPRYNHGWMWKFFCILGGWGPVFLKDHAAGLLTKPLPPLWVWLFIPIGPFIWILKNWFPSKQQQRPEPDPATRH